MHLERLLPTRECHVKTSQRHRKSNYLQHESDCEEEEERTGCRRHGCRSHNDVQSALPLLLATLLLRRAIRSNCASNCCLNCDGRRQRVQPDCGESLPASDLLRCSFVTLELFKHGSVLKWESRRKNAGSCGFVTPSEQLLAAPEADGSLRRHHTQAERSHLISSFKSWYSAGQLD